MRLDPKTTALVLIDLQQGIVARQTAPHSARDVVDRAAKLAKHFREIGAAVVLVNVMFSPDDGDRLKPEVDSPTPVTLPIPPSFGELVPEIGPEPNDILITKRQWGAFYGTALELQLRRRGITTIVIAGISTNFGVESTARDAWERNYALVFAEDAMAAFSAEAHEFAVKNIFPRIGRVRTVGEIVEASPEF